MKSLPLDRIQTHRARTFRTGPGQRLASKAQALDYANERGFIFFWPIKDVVMPSLWSAVAGDRPVADGHDDPGHVTWGWKDDLLSQRRWYYSKLLRRRATIISLELAPSFYALSPNYGSPDEDYLIEYEEGRMTLETRLVYEALLKEGALNTIDLRKAARLTNTDGLFNRALEQLQVDMRILPVGVSEAGAWRYSFIYNLVHRHYPDLIERARVISEHDARRTLVSGYFSSLGAASYRELQRLFNHWRAQDLRHTVETLTQSGKLVRVEIENQQGEAYAAPALLES